MFDIGWSEIVVIAVVALIAIGPKELPAVLRTIGQYMGKIRRMANEFQGQFREAMREAEMADIKKQVDEMTSAAQDITRYNPLDDVQAELNSALTDKPAQPSAAAASPEAAASAVPAPVGADVTIPSGEHVAVAAEAPQPSPEFKPEPAAETKPVSGGGG